MTYYTSGNDNYVAAGFTNSAYSKVAAEKYIEYWDSQGWFNSQWGKVTAHFGFTGNLTGNVTGNADSATAAGHVNVTACNSTSNSKLWDNLTVDTNKVKFWDVYNDGGPSTYGNIFEINGISNHWKPQLWFEGRGDNYGRIYYRNRGYDYTSWSDWKTLAFTSDIPTNISQLTNDAGYTTATGHTHDWSNINNVVVASNEFNFVPSGFNSEIWLNYRGKDSTSATVTGYRFGNGAGGCAPLYASNSITTSDRRLKKNITEIDDDRLKKALDLNFYEFDYRNTDGHSAGHVAQDVREVLPEFVRENNSKKDDINYLSLDYTGLHSMQIKALKNKCERLEDENKSLQSRIEKLEKLIEKLL